MEIITKPYVPKIVAETFLSLSIFFVFFIGLGIFVSFLTKNLLFVFLGFILSLIITLIYLPLTIGAARNTQYKISNDFIARKKVFISVNQDDVPVSQITNVDYNVSWFLDRIFNTGSVLVYTSGSGGAELSVYGVKDYMKVYDEISDLIDSQKEVFALKTKTEYVKKESTHFLTIKPASGVGTLISLLSFTPFYILFFYFTFYILSFFVFLILISVLVLILGIWINGNLRKTEFNFYSDKLIFYQGFLSLNKSTVPYERITNINLTNSFLNRIFGVSTILVETSGSVISNININYVENGDDIIKQLKEVLKEHGRN